MLLVHQAPRHRERSSAIAPGVQALPWDAFVVKLGSGA
jgi:hypothetical protein